MSSISRKDHATGQLLVSGDTDAFFAALRVLAPWFREFDPNDVSQPGTALPGRTHSFASMASGDIALVAGTRYRAKLTADMVTWPRWSFTRAPAGDHATLLIPESLPEWIRPGKVDAAVGGWGVGSVMGSDDGAVFELASAAPGDMRWYRAGGTSRYGNHQIGRSQISPLLRAFDESHPILRDLWGATPPEIYAALSVIDRWYNVFVVKRAVIDGGTVTVADMGGALRADLFDGTAPGSYFLAVAEATDMTLAADDRRIGVAMADIDINDHDVDVPGSPTDGVLWYQATYGDLNAAIDKSYVELDSEADRAQVRTMRDVLQSATPTELPMALNALAGDSGIEDSPPNLGGMRLVPVSFPGTEQHSFRFPLNHGAVPYCYIRKSDNRVFQVATATQHPLPATQTPIANGAGISRIYVPGGSWHDAVPTDPSVKLGDPRVCRMNIPPEVAATNSDGYLLVADFVVDEYLDLPAHRFGFRQ